MELRLALWNQPLIFYFNDPDIHVMHAISVPRGLSLAPSQPYARRRVDVESQTELPSFFQNG